MAQATIVHSACLPVGFPTREDIDLEGESSLVAVFRLVG